MTHRILVTNGEQRATLAVVRSLGRSGYEPIVCSVNGRSLAGASRYCLADEPIPDAPTGGVRYLDRLLEICDGWRPHFLIPVTDEANVAILPAARRFGDVEILAAEWASFARISDKREVSEAGRKVGMAVPRGIVIDDPSGVAPEVLAGIPYPLVVKSSRSVVRSAGKAKTVSVFYAGTRAELLDLLRALPVAAYPVLVQERIEGHGSGLFLLRWDGQTLAAFAHRRIREKPPTGGVSVYRESIRLEPELLTRSERLLDLYDWQGVAMVEFKTCRESGIHYLMEVNGRFWGSLQLAIDAGVDFPALLVAAAAGQPRAHVTGYRTGVRCRWFWGDVDHTLALLRQRPRLALSARANAVLRLFRPPLPKDRWEVLRASDPGPFLRETRGWSRQALIAALSRRDARALQGQASS